MRISPVSSVNVISAQKQSFKGSACATSDFQEEQANARVIALVSGKDWIKSLEMANKSMAEQDMQNELFKMEHEDICPITRKNNKEELEAMKNSIIEDCLTFDDYKGERFSYASSMGHFKAWQDYVNEENERLSDIMNAPYSIAQEERCSISRYSEENPDSPVSEILESRIYKMYKLLRMNKPARSHFHD